METQFISFTYIENMTRCFFHRNRSHLFVGVKCHIQQSELYLGGQYLSVNEMKNQSRTTIFISLSMNIIIKVHLTTIRVPML